MLYFQTPTDLPVVGRCGVDATQGNKITQELKNLSWLLSEERLVLSEERLVLIHLWLVDLASVHWFWR